MSVSLNHRPGKYAARLGLSFFSTVETHPVPCFFSPFALVTHVLLSISIQIAEDRILMLLDRTASDSTITTDGCCIVRESAYKKIIKRALPVLITSGAHA